MVAPHGRSRARSRAIPAGRPSRGGSIPADRSAIGRFAAYLPVAGRGSALNIPSGAYFTPDINFTVGLIIIAISSAATRLNAATASKTVNMGMEAVSDAALPESQL